MSQYRRHIMNFASAGRRRQNLHSITLNELSLSQLELPTEELLEEQEVADDTTERERMKLKMNVRVWLRRRNSSCPCRMPR